MLAEHIFDGGVGGGVEGRVAGGREKKTGGRRGIVVGSCRERRNYHDEREGGEKRHVKKTYTRGGGGFWR